MNEASSRTCPRCKASIPGPMLGCPACGECDTPAPVQPAWQPIPLATVSLLGLVLLIGLTALTVAHCWGGCHLKTNALPLALLAMATMAESMLSLYAIRLALTSSGTRKVMAVLLAAPGALFSLLLLLWIAFAVSGLGKLLSL